MLAALLATACVGGVPVAVGGSTVGGLIDPAAQLSGVLSSKNVNEQVVLVRALRQLRDPALAPLFARLSANGAGPVKGQAALALAQLQPAAGLDLMVVRRLGVSDQALVLSEALREGLLPTTQLGDVLRWEDLPPVLFCSIAGRLIDAGEPVDTGRLRALTDNPHEGTAAIAAILLRHRGQGDAVKRTLDRMFRNRSVGADRDLRIVLQFLRERSLDSAADVPARVLAERAADPLMVYEAVATALVVDPDVKQAAASWAKRFKTAADVGDQMRYAMAALTAATERRDPAQRAALAALVAPVLQAVGEDQPRLVAMGNALADSGDTDQTADLALRLARFEHPPTLAWLLKRAGSLKPERAQAVREAVLQAAAGGEEPGLAEPVIEAARSLVTEDPGALAGMIAIAKSKGCARTASRLLEGALRAPTALGPTWAADATAWPDARSAALAAVLRARAQADPGAALDEGVMEDLRRAASGLGDLPQTVRVQAAWLALRHENQGQAALARILVNVPTDAGSP